MTAKDQAASADETAAVERFHESARLTEHVTVLIFVVSGLLACLLAIVVSRLFARGLIALKAGADAIGAGNLAYRIRILPGTNWVRSRSPSTTWRKA